ncbi:hypothetical protein PLESTB_001143100 [Pleodorina starrii]|uniref:TOG domain-containing protein n=1 Tax=Pleodorina starrii TaxID=330485 RepID=A0A9W6BRI9_9CHLO|nr:hypothetical protein PLESTM_000561500 [Pleodorina starrii]GLC56763.1 hypothetical protein PLESTB_001143100 [Pleodorina starrii]GLC66918.1 hypothetical protein PLESTF_000490300 [Pleodorina starrii]
MSGSVWNNIKEDLQASSKQKLSGLEGLEALLKRTSLGKTELVELIDLSPSLLSDANSKVALQALEALALAVSRADAPVSSYASSLVPSVAERLGDSRQPVREQALHLLTALFKTLKPELVLDRLAPLWQHKSWKVKQGLLEVLAEVVSTSGASFLGGRDQNNAVLKQIVRMMEEPEMIVREAALGCLSEIHRQTPAAVVSTVQASNLRPAQQKEVLARLGVALPASDVSGPDVSSKRVHDTMGAYVSDAGTASSSGGGYYLTPDLTAPMTIDSSRVSGGGQSAGGDTASGWAADARRQSAAAAGPSQTTAAAPAKRGGFKDGGGVTLDGELPPATPIPITSERELRSELEAATATLALAPNADWQARMSAMQRVEGLVLGGAVDWECFHEAMKGLAQALSQQFKERRSTIARQTCHLIGVLSRALGPRFEPYALVLLPTLFGVLVITVAVMAESADVGVRGILRHCQTGRLLQAIADGVCREKNPKTRQFCASYIIQILEEWDVGIWSRQTDSVETAIRAAVQDSTADTRQYSRTAMALYHGAQPDRAQAFLKRLDSSLQDKLAGGLVGAKPAKPAPATFSRQSISAAIAANKRLARQGGAPADAADSGIVVMVAAPKSEQAAPEPALRAQQRPAMRTGNAFAGPQPSAGSASTSGDAVPEGDVPSRPLTGRTSRKSMGLPPGRIPGGSADLTAFLGDSSNAMDAATQARIAALRRPRMSVAPHELPQRVLLAAGPPGTPALRAVAEVSAALRVPVAQTPEQQSSRPPVVPAASALSSIARSAGASQPDRGNTSSDPGAAGGGGLVPLPRVVSIILAGPRTWSDKVDALAALTAHVCASVPGGTLALGEGPDVTLHASTLHQAGLVAEPEKVSQALLRVREVLVEALEDPHQKVLAAALTLMREVVRHYSRVMEGQLDRVLPLLLNKGAENKEQARALCGDILDECGQIYRPDVLVPALSKCLDVVKQPRGKQMALEFFRSHAEQWGAFSSTHLKHWLVRLAPLLDDRTPDLRKRAADVLDTLLAAAWTREPINYVAYQHNSPDVGPLRKYLAAHPAAGPSAQVTSGSWSDGGAGALQSLRAGTASMTISGAPPATTSDPRRHLPSATMAAPVMAAGPQAQHPGMGSALQRGQPPPPFEEARPEPSGTGSSRQAWSSSPSHPPPSNTVIAASAGYRASAAPGGQQTVATQRGPAQTGPPGSRPPGTPGPGTSGSASSHPGTTTDTSSVQYVSSTTSPMSQGPRRPLQVPQEANAQLVFLARLLDAARAAIGNGQGSAGGAGPAVSKDQQAAAMEDLADAIQRCSRDAWVRTFPLLMVEISSWVQQPTCGVRTWAFWLLKELLLRQQHLFTDNNLESQLNLLLQGCGDLHRDVVMTAGQALQILLSVCNERHAVLLLQQLLQREREAHLRAHDKGARVVAILDGTRQLIMRLERSELQRMAFQAHPDTRITLLEGLVANLSDPETSVRRSAVLTAAGLWYRLGHGVRDVLQVLAAPSFNLLCIYYLKLHGVVVDAGQQDVSQHPLIQLGGGN